MVEPIDLVVLDGDLAGLDRVGVDQRAQDAVDEDAARSGHLGQMDVALERRLGGQLDDRLGDGRARDRPSARARR